MSTPIDLSIDELIASVADTTSWDRVERFARMGTWGWRPGTDELVWSENLFRMIGFEPGELVPSPASLLERVHPGDVDRLREGLDEVRAGAELPPMRYRVLMGDGSVRHMEAVQTLDHGGEVAANRRLVGFVRDVSEQREADLALAAGAAVAGALSGWDSPGAGVERLLRELSVALGAIGAALLVPRAETLEIVAEWKDAEAPTGSLCARPPVRGVGLAGIAWERGAPIAAPPRLGSSEEPALVLAVPARDAGRVVALLAFYSHEPLESGPRLLATLAAAGEQLGSFLARRPAVGRRPRLTARELEVLRLAAEGLAAADIRDRLGVSHSTVKSHLEHIYDKLGVSNRVAAVAGALREGLIE